MSENRSPLAALKSIGPAIIVAAVVLGPGSILVSSKVGAVFGYTAISVLVLAIILLIAALVATFGFWSTLKAILGAIGVIVLVCLLVFFTVAFLAAWLMRR